MFELPEYIQYYVRELLILSLVVMGAVVVLLFVIVIAHKAYVEDKEREHKRLKIKYISALKLKLSDPNAKIPMPKKNIEYDVLADTVIEMLQGCSLQAGDVLRRCLIELGLVEHYKKVACSRSYIKHLIAIEKLGLFKQMELKPFFVALVKNEKKNIESLARLIIALSYIADNEEDIIYISSLMSGDIYMMKSSKFHVAIFYNVIEALKGRKREGVYIDYINDIEDRAEVPFILKRDMIDTCGEALLHSSRDVVMDYLVSFENVPEMKITCLRALGKMGDVKVGEALRKGIKSEDWRIRVTATKYAYVCAQAYESLVGVLDNLREALYDENFHVRLNAATSLMKIGTKGILILKEEAAKSLNRFTKEIATYLLEEANLRA